MPISGKMRLTYVSQHVPDAEPEIPALLKGDFLLDAGRAGRRRGMAVGSADILAKREELHPDLERINDDVPVPELRIKLGLSEPSGVQDEDTLPQPSDMDAAGGLLLGDRMGAELYATFNQEAEEITELQKAAQQLCLSGVDPEKVQEVLSSGSPMDPAVLSTLGLHECAIPGGTVRVLSPVARQKRKVGRLEQIRMTQRLGIPFPRGRAALTTVHPRDQGGRRRRARPAARRAHSHSGSFDEAMLLAGTSRPLSAASTCLPSRPASATSLGSSLDRGWSSMRERESARPGAARRPWSATALGAVAEEAAVRGAPNSRASVGPGAGASLLPPRPWSAAPLERSRSESIWNDIRDEQQPLSPQPDRLRNVYRTPVVPGVAVPRRARPGSGHSAPSMRQRPGSGRSRASLDLDERVPEEDLLPRAPETPPASRSLGWSVYPSPGPVRYESSLSEAETRALASPWPQGPGSPSPESDGVPEAAEPSVIRETLEQLLHVALDLRRGLGDAAALQLFGEATEPITGDWGYLLNAASPSSELLRVQQEFPRLAAALPLPGPERPGRYGAVRAAFTRLAAQLPAAGTWGDLSRDGPRGLVGWELSRG